MISKRNPFPLIRYENDDTFSQYPHHDSTIFTGPVSKSTWTRLNNAHTSSSARHTVSSLPFQPDHLDFHLHALYDNHRDWWKSNAEALVQVETEKHLCCARSHRTTIRKNASIQPRRLLTSWTSSCREHLSHVTEAIDGHHLQATNGGYSRKPNGNKFTA
ncbi:Protein C1orf194 [Clonorchis sinensis]|uniref:Protein C1orf194 n=1 Tax=Clonorchis sinensis TaxID=79923 RepID=A0A8T1LUN6_CLOSI|nr:Protein C1orf194 [Clonorchis sinensis]